MLYILTCLGIISAAASVILCKWYALPLPWNILIILPAYAFMNRKNGKSLVTVLITLLLGMTILALPQCSSGLACIGKKVPSVPACIPQGPVSG